MKTQAAILIAALSVAASPALADRLVYIPQGDPGEVLVVDSKTDKIVGRIGGMENIHGLAGTPDGKYLLAGSYDETTVKGKAVPKKPEGVSEDEHQAHHAKRTKAAVAKDGAVSYASVIRTADRAIIRRIAVPGAVHHAAVTPDGRFAIMTHPNQDGVSVIDLNTFTVVGTVSTGPVPNYAVASKDSKRVYVSNAGNDTISEIDTGRWIVRRNIVVGKSPEHLVMSPDGERLFVNNVDGGSVSEISLATGKVTRTLEIGGEVHGLDLSDDGKTLFVAGRERGIIVAFDLAGGNRKAQSPAAGPYHLMAISGTGKLYVSSAEEPKIWVLDQQTLKQIGEISIEGKGHQMVLGAIN